MAGERNLYRKVQVVLEYAKDAKHRDLESLRNHILNKKPTNFIYYWRDRESDQIQSGYSEKSIDAVLLLCIDLRLIDGTTFALTKAGTSATDARRFPVIVGKRVSELLESKGLSVEHVSRAIRTILHNTKPSAPTSKEIWNYLQSSDDSVDLPLFSQLLNLLGQCEVLQVTQKRIFLPL